MGLNLSTNLPIFADTFQAMRRHRPLKEYSVFVGIRVACTSFSPYTLVPMATFLKSRTKWYLLFSDSATTSAQCVFGAKI